MTEWAVRTSEVIPQTRHTLILQYTEKRALSLGTETQHDTYTQCKRPALLLSEFTPRENLLHVYEKGKKEQAFS